MENEGPLTLQAKCKCGETVAVNIDRFADKEYVRWIISTAGLYYTKQGLERFAEDGAQTFYVAIQEKLQAAINCQCDLNEIAKKAFNCPNKVCTELKAELESKSKYKLVWKNVNLNKVTSSEELSKLYLPPGTVDDYNGPASVDISAVLRLIDGCRPIEDTLVDKTLNTIQPVRDSRNDIMHSNDMSVTEADLAKHVASFKALLKNVPKEYTECNDAIGQIEKLDIQAKEGRPENLGVLQWAEAKALIEWNISSMWKLLEWKEELCSASGIVLKALKQKIKKHEIEQAVQAVKMRIFNMNPEEVENIEKRREESAALFIETEEKHVGEKENVDVVTNIQQAVNGTSDPLLQGESIPQQVSSGKNMLAARNLQQFTCWDVDDAAAVSDLVDVLPQLNMLQQLKLGNKDFGSLSDIRLSTTMGQLESVVLMDCTFSTAGLDCLLQQNNLPQRRVRIEIIDVTIRGEEDIINKIRQSPDTVVAWDEDVKYSEGEWKVGFFIFYTRNWDRRDMTK